MKAKIAKAYWALNRAKFDETEVQSHHSIDGEKSSSADNASENESSTGGWRGAQIQFYQPEEMKNYVILIMGQQ